MDYREMYAEVVTSGSYSTKMRKVKRLAQLVSEDKELTIVDCACRALELLEEMTGTYLDPTQEQYDEIKNCIMGECVCK